MGALTATIPKPLLPNPENSLIRHQIDLLRRHVNYLYVTAGYQKEILKKNLAQFEVDAIMDVEGHGNAYFINLLQGIPLDSRILVITCDNLMKIDLAMLAIETRSFSSSFIVPKVTINQTTGDFIEHQDGFISTMRRKTGVGAVASGLQVLHAEDIELLQQESVNDFSEVWEYLIGRKSLRISKTPIESWWAIDTEIALKQWSNCDD
jgi:NDP-sugar pyrophosphorylase family protein